MKLITVSAETLPFAWPEVLPWIQQACERVPSELSPDDLRGICERQEGQLVLIGEDKAAPLAAGVVQVRDYGDGVRSFWVLALGGSGARIWRDTLRIIEDAGRRMGCASVQFVGRPGWAGLLPDYDCHVSYAKRLD